MSIGRLHVLTDFRIQQQYAHAELAELAIGGGADTIQFRQKSGGLRHQLHDAHEVARVCTSAGVPLIINDRIDMMLATGAAGVHLGQRDFPVAEARRILGPEVIIGATATTAEQAARVEEEGASYVGFGPVYPTNSKQSPASVKGLAGLTSCCKAVSIPVIAIAGMTPDRVEDVLRAGAHGIAVLSAVVTSDDPAQATRAFRTALDEALADA